MDDYSAKQQTIEFWDARSRGYSISTRKELEDETSVLRNIMRNQMGINKRLKVVDMGTGAGLAAITMARLGHDVTAVDASEKMLEEARQNALLAKVDINFVLGDVSSPPLLKHSFDLVVAKSIVWTLLDPMTAYSAWISLLKPGGSILIIDGNWYLDEFDEDFRKRRNYIDMKYGVDNNLHAHANVDNVDLNIIRKLACNFPASRERRPAWDIGVLIGLGMSDIHVLSLDKEPFSVLTREGFMRIPLQFAMIARLPRDQTSPYNEVMRPELYTEDDLKAITERLNSLDFSFSKVLKALSDQNRLSIVSALMGGRMSVNQLATVTNESTSLASHNLKTLKDCNIVKSERDGKEIMYYIADRDAVNNILDTCTYLLYMNK
jgi:SAM-dependent methyltransferase